MDKRKLPISILKALDGIKNLLESKNLDFVTNPNDKFNLNITINDKVKGSDFFFSLQSYSRQSGMMILNAKIKPKSEDDVEAGDAVFYVNDLERQLKIWLELLELYDSTDFTLFNKKLKLIKTDLIGELKNASSLIQISLKQLQVENYYDILDLKLLDIPLDNQWIFFVGENGFGKTLILQSIFIGLFGKQDENYLLVDNKETQIFVEYKTKTEVSISKHINDSEPVFDDIVAIGSSRLNLSNESQSEFKDKSRASYSLFNTDGLLLNIDAELYRLAIKNDARFELIVKAIKILLNPYLNDIRYNKNKDCIFYYESSSSVNETIDSYEEVRYDQLASGFKSMIAIAGDIILRLSKKQEVKKPQDLVGIVIIDEIDLHWHPKLQKNIPKHFSAVFPNIQFIVSTHSPLPLLTAPENSIIYKVTRNKVEGIKAEKINIEIKNLTPNLLLTSPIFDMDSVISIQNTNFDEVRIEEDYAELLNTNKVNDKINLLQIDKKKFPDSLFGK